MRKDGDWPLSRHYYYDFAGRVIAEALELGGTRPRFQVDREYIWGAAGPDDLVCRVERQYDAAGKMLSETRFSPLRDEAGRVPAIVAEI